MPSEADRPPPRFAVGDRVQVEYGTAKGQCGNVVRIFLHAARPDGDLVVVHLADTDGRQMTVSVYPKDLTRAD